MTKIINSAINKLAQKEKLRAINPLPNQQLIFSTNIIYYL